MGKRLEELEAAVTELYKLSGSASALVEDEIAPLKSALVAATYKVDAVTNANAELQQKVSGLEKDLAEEKKKSIGYCAALQEVVSKRFDAVAKRVEAAEKVLDTHSLKLNDVLVVAERASSVVKDVENHGAVLSESTLYEVTKMETRQRVQVAHSPYLNHRSLPLPTPKASSMFPSSSICLHSLTSSRNRYLMCTKRWWLRKRNAVVKPMQSTSRSRARFSRTGDVLRLKQAARQSKSKPFSSSSLDKLVSV